MATMHSEETSTPPIAIIGGGLAGLTLSIGLSHNNIPHKIYESAKAFAEIGAGIALGPNSVRALEQIDPRINAGFRRCVTYNEGVETDEFNNGIGGKSAEWMDVRVGMKTGFSDLIAVVSHKGSPKPGRACFHRAKFLDELIKLVPRSSSHFGKTLTSLEPAKDQSGNIILHFADGMSASASAVIACDGIKSVVRRSYILADTPNVPCGRPQSSHEYAYRGMYTKEQFVSLTNGEISPSKGTIFCGADGYIVIYPVEKGKFINMVAIKRVPETLSTNTAIGEQGFKPLEQDDTSWVQIVSKESMIADFADWGETIQTLLSEIKRPERWALFDHFAAPTYVRGKVAILGDAAHASTPHQGQGAGMAFEDSLIMSATLGKVLGTSQGIPYGSDPALGAKLEACFKAYDEVRRPRTQEVCRTSREMGEMIEFVLPGFGNDLAKIQANLNMRMDWIWDVNLRTEVQRAVEIAQKML